MSSDPKNQGRNTAPETGQNLLDELRKPGGEGREIIPWWVLAGVFSVVLVVVLYLMLPKFPSEFTRFQSLRYQKQGRFEKAVPYLNWLQERDPKSVTYLSELGNAYLHMEKWDEAITWFSQAQNNIDPDVKDDEGRPLPVPDFNTQIGTCYLRKNDLPKAEEYLRKALAFDKLDKYANFGMGELQFLKGNMPAATESFKMVARDPQFADKVKEYYRKIEDRLFAGIGVDASLKGTTITLAVTTPAATPTPTPVNSATPTPAKSATPTAVKAPTPAPVKGPTVTWGTNNTRTATITSPPKAAGAPATTISGTAASTSTGTR